jgi:hypothetical protein
MGAQDYVTANQAPSYAAPLVDNFLGQLAKLPEGYFQGTQRARTLELQKPILGPDRQPTYDIKTIISEMNRRGGGEFIGSLLLFLQKQAVLDQGNGQTTPQSIDTKIYQPPNTGPRSGFCNTTGPANLKPGPPLQQASATPPHSRRRGRI